MTNPRVVARSDARDILAGAVFFATVYGTDGDLVLIQRFGETTPDPQPYPTARGLAATVSPGDVVLCVVGGGVPYVTQVFEFESS